MPLPLSADDESMTDAPPADLTSLARVYGRPVFHAAYRVLGDTSQAEDVQQEVFLRLLQKPDATVTSWPAYLTTLAVRLSIDRLRSRQRWRRLLPIWRASTATPFDSTEQAAVQAEKARRLRAALCVLKRREAECFTLRFVQGMEIAAIAQATAMSVNHVSVCLHRATRALEARLADTETMSSTEVL